ncbi:MAG TPA: SPFH domain-containing protein [Candidatus Paceibacterota bacterium]
MLTQILIYAAAIAATLFGLWFFVGLAIRALANKEILWFFTPGNTYALLVRKGNETTDLTEGGGGIVGIAHDIPGHRLIIPADNNLFNAEFVEGEEDRGLLHRLYGVHWKGPFKDLRRNALRSFRYGRKDKEETYHVFPEDQKTKFVFFSSNQAVKVDNAETAGAFGLDIIYNIIFERKHPVKAIVRVADANAVLSQKAEARTIALTGSKPPDYYLYGDVKQKEELTDAIEGIAGDTLSQLGIFITDASLFSIDPDEAEKKLRELLQLAEKTRLEQAAKIQVAEADKKVTILAGEAAKEVQMLANEADEDRVNRVILPVAREPGGPAVRFAEAYESNETVTTLSIGGKGMGIIIPQPDKGKSAQPEK